MNKPENTKSSSTTKPPSPRGRRRKGHVLTDPRTNNKPPKPGVRRALRVLKQGENRHREAFQFLDTATCYDPDEWARENRCAIEKGFTGSRLVNHMSKYAARGRLALVSGDRELSLLVRTFDKEEGLIRHHRYSLSRPCGFYCPLLLVKTPEEIEKERLKLQSALEYEDEDSEGSDSDDDYDLSTGDESANCLEEEEEASSYWDEEERVWPLKEVSFLKLYRNSIYARRFDSQTFDPSPQFYKDAEADPKGAKAQTYNSFCGLRWTPQQARSEYESWSSEKRAEADRRAAIIMDHMKFQACRGDEEMLQYLLRWILSLVIHPQRRMLTMLVFVGESGCGKSVLVQNVIGPLFGSHFAYNSDLGDLLGTFNARVADTILAYADEARVRAGSRAAAQLKVLITEGPGSLRLCRKYHDAVYVDSFMNLIGSVENLEEFQVDLQSRRYVPFLFASDKRGDKEYFKRLIDAAVDEKRMGLLAFLVNLLDTVDIAGFDRGQELPVGRNRAIRQILEADMMRNVFRDWACKWVNRGYIVPRSEMDDLSITENEHVQWLDPQGRTYATRGHPWVCEMQSELLYARFRKDMGYSRLSDSQIKAGLESARLLRPESCGKKPIRRWIYIEERSPGGKVFVKSRKTYLTLLRCEDYESMFFTLSDSSDGEGSEADMGKNRLLPPGDVSLPKDKGDHTHKARDGEVSDEAACPPNETCDYAAEAHQLLYRKEMEIEKRERSGRQLQHQPLGEGDKDTGSSDDDDDAPEPAHKRSKRHHPRSAAHRQALRTLFDALYAIAEESSPEDDKESNKGNRVTGVDAKHDSYAVD